jgi:hypothetical protein
MQYHDTEKRDALLLCGQAFTAESFNREPATVDLPPAGAAFLQSSTDQGATVDYSEEAIPERDPTYRLTDGTLHDSETVEHVPAEVRLALARALEELGMSPSRAALMASL